MAQVEKNQTNGRIKPSFAKATEGKGELFLVMDLGSAFLKAGLARVDSEKQKVFLLSYSQASVPLGCFEKKFSFNPELLSSSLDSLIREIEQTSGHKPQRYLLGVNSDYLSGQIFNFSFKRPNPQDKLDLGEMENIFIKIVRQIAEKIKAEEKTVLKDGAVQVIEAHLGQLFIDGYEVRSLEGLTGQRLEGKIFSVYTSKSCWQQWQAFLRGCQKKEIKLLPGFWSIVNVLPEKDCLLIDLGAKHTEISLKRQGFLQAHLGFGVAGFSFSRALAEALGVGYEEAEEIKLKFIRKELSVHAQERLDKVIQPVFQSWSQGLLLGLCEIAANSLLPEKIFLVGGGSLLPDLASNLKKMLQAQDLPFLNREHLFIKYLTTKDIDDLEDEASQISDAQKIVVGCLARTALEVHPARNHLAPILKKAVRLAS